MPYIKLIDFKTRKSIYSGFGIRCLNLVDFMRIPSVIIEKYVSTRSVCNTQYHRPYR